MYIQATPTDDISYTCGNQFVESDYNMDWTSFVEYLLYAVFSFNAKTSEQFAYIFVSQYIF